MSRELPPCTVEGCDRPTQQYLCHQCTDELRVAWCQIVPLLPVLLLISRNQEQAFTQKTAGGRGGSTGSKPPINISAMQLLDNLRQALVFTPNEYAGHSDGAWSKWMIEQWVTTADIMVNGEQEDADKKSEYSKLRLKIMPVLSPAEMVEWFASEEGPGVTITEDQLKNWKHRGRLHRYNSTGRPKYHAADVYLAYQNQGSTGWRPHKKHGNQAYPETSTTQPDKHETNTHHMV